MGDAMIGVVLWSDPVDMKAVFWCEDQGDLAYFDGSQQASEYETVFDAGDMVEFDLEIDRKLRKAVNAQVIKQKVCVGLQEQLRTSARAGGSVDAPDRGSKVIAFKPRMKKMAAPFRKLKA